MVVDLTKLESREEDVTNLLQQQKEDIDKNILATKKVEAGSRERFGQNITDIISDVASKAGVAPGSISEGLGEVGKKLDLESESALSLKKVRQRRDNVTRTFNFAFNRLEQAGLDVQSARENAINIALRLDEQEFTAEEASKNRRQIQARQQIQDELNEALSKLNEEAARRKRKEALKLGIVRALFGFAGSLAGAGISGLLSKGAAAATSTVGPTAGTSVLPTTASQGGTAGVSTITGT